MIDSEESSERGDNDAKRVLDHSRYSNCYSGSFRRRLSVMTALNKDSVNTTLNHYSDGNPFEKEFSQAVESATTGDQHEMTYGNTWPQDSANLSPRKYDFDQRQTMLFCNQSPGAKATNRTSKPSRKDIVDIDMVTTIEATDAVLAQSDDSKLSLAERFGPLSSGDIRLQDQLNIEFQSEFELCSAQLQFQGPDDFFGTRSTESCGPRIIEFHRKSHSPVVAAAKTQKTELPRLRDNKNVSFKETNLDKESTASSFDSDDMKELDLEIDKLQLEHDDEHLAKAVSQQENTSAKSESNTTVDEKNGRGKKKKVKTPDTLVNINSMENFDGHLKSSSPKNTSASFFKRHASFLFKNFRTPKLVRRKSNAESMKKTLSQATCSQRPQATASSLTRSSTMGPSDVDQTGTGVRFQCKTQQVQTGLDDTVVSEMDNSMNVALDGRPFSSTMKYATLDERTMRKPKSEPSKTPGTLRRTVTMYRSLTQRIREKFRRYDHDESQLDVASDSCQEFTMPKDLDPETRDALMELQEKVKCQDTMIYQTSKGLQLCNAMREFTASDERVEYERLLLIASETKKAILAKMNSLIMDKTANNNEYVYIERGEVTLQDIRLQLREDVLRRERQNGNIVEWFVIVMIQGMTVWATPPIACPTSSPQIYFPGQYVFSGLTPDFHMSIKVYSLQLQQLELFEHNDKYHITRSNEFTGDCKMKSPKTMRKKAASPKHLKVKFTGIKESSFVYCGGVDLMLYDLKLPSPWPLTSVAANSVLHGTVDLKLSCKLELSMFHAGFLTHCEESADLSWNRRWCLLEGHSLLFWNYPREQEYKPPMYIIDLANCVSGRIDLIDRRLCARPRTVLLETTSKTNEKDQNALEGKSASPIARHLLSCDTNSELSEWQSKLNHVVSALRDWNVIHTARTP